jgi:hypothetical protein
MMRVLFVTTNMFCECCGMQLRGVYKERVRAKKNQLVSYELSTGLDKNDVVHVHVPI